MSDPILSEVVVEDALENQPALDERGIPKSALRSAYRGGLMATAKAPCYYWADYLTTILPVESLPVSWILNKELLHSPSGFMWFETPVDKVMDFGSGSPMGGFSWYSEDEAVWIEFFSYTPEVLGVIPLSFLPTGALFLEFGTSLKEMLEKIEEITIEAGKLRYPLKVRWFCAIQSFLNQKILMSTHDRVDRASARRLERAGNHVNPYVNVVRLRSQIHRDRPATAQEIEWTCQWVVRGHWREQWYPVAEEHRPVWIAPYIKGPEDKPFRESEKIFAVVR